MLDFFNKSAVAFMQVHYGKNFLIDYTKSDDSRICFNSVDHSGKRFLRKYLLLPDWLSQCITVEVDKATGEEIPVVSK